MNMSTMSDMMMSMSNKTDAKLGYTTTVKEQVDEIQNKIEHFKKTIEIQRKQQSQIHFQLKKLQEQSRVNFGQMAKEIGERVNYVSQLFKNDSKNEGKQFQYLQLQNSILKGEHDKLNQLSSLIGSRTHQIQSAVGF